MKRTTYIIFGVLLAGLLVMSGVIFYVSLHTIAWDDFCLEIGGERKTVALPPCEVVKVVHPQEWKQVKEGIVTREQFIDWGETKLVVSSADSSRCGFSFAADMEKFVSVSAVGDTALISFDFGDGKLEKRFQDSQYLRVKSEEMRLNLPEDVRTIRMDVEGLATVLHGLHGDTLSCRVRDWVLVEDCRLTSLSMQAATLHLHSGEVRDLYLDLDDTHDWDVNVDSFHIDTEHLTGGRMHHNALQQGECRRLLWTPKNEGASLNVNIHQAAEMELKE